MLPALPAAAVDWTYTVRPGDSAWTIARRFCREKTCWPDIARHNGMGPTALPRAGQRLRVPVRLLARRPISATAAVVTGEAWMRRRGAAEQRLAGNDRLEIDDRVRTAAGTVTVRFADGSELVLGPQSEIVFDMLGAFGDGGMVDTQVRALRGRLEPRVAPRPGGSSFRIVTPTGTAVVRGTEFRIRAEDASFAELTRGALAFDGAGGSTDLAAGFGVVAAPGRATPPPEALLPAPVLAAGEPTRSLPLEVRWAPVAGATGYRVLLFRSGAEAVLVSVHDTPAAPAGASPPTTLSLAPEPGRYRVVVRAIAASGLEGLDGSSEITVVGARPQPRISADGITLDWPAIAGATGYELELARDRAFADVLLRTRLSTPTYRAEITPGRAWARVRAATALGNTDFSTPLALDHAPATPTLSADARSWDSDAWRLEWTTVPGARYRLQYAPDDRFDERRTDIVTGLRSWSLTCPHARCSVRVRAEIPVQAGTGDTSGTGDAVTSPWSAPVQVGRGGFLRMLEPRG
jgi:hypothetical protein